MLLPFPQQTIPSPVETVMTRFQREHQMIQDGEARFMVWVDENDIYHHRDCLRSFDGDLKSFSLVISNPGTFRCCTDCDGEPELFTYGEYEG